MNGQPKLAGEWQLQKGEGFSVCSRASKKELVVALWVKSRCGYGMGTQEVERQLLGAGARELVKDSRL
jgi:hypothetical protein